MKKLSLFLVLIIALFCYSNTLAQDPQFSQFYANPIYHNPAFAGREGRSRLILNHRMQWYKFGKGYQTPAVSFDSYFDGTKFGVGGQVVQQWQDSYTQTTMFSAQVSHWFNLSKRNETPLYLRIGIQPEWIINTYNPLTYVDQLSSSGAISNSNDPIANNGPLTRSNLGFSGGAMLEYGSDEESPAFWTGVTLHHINHFIFRDQQKQKSPWTLDDQRLGIQAGISIPLDITIRPLENGTGKDWDRVKNLKFTGYFRKQGPNSQLDLGVNFMYSPMMLGVWYRGIPIQKYNNIVQQDALIFMAGFEHKIGIFQYSYDATVSSFQSGKPGGTHELSLWFLFEPLQVKFRRNKLTNCKMYR